MACCKCRVRLPCPSGMFLLPLCSRATLGCQELVRDSVDCLRGVTFAGWSWCILFPGRVPIRVSGPSVVGRRRASTSARNGNSNATETQRTQSQSLLPPVWCVRSIPRRVSKADCSLVRGFYSSGVFLDVCHTCGAEQYVPREMPSTCFDRLPSPACNLPDTLRRGSSATCSAWRRKARSLSSTCRRCSLPWTGRFWRRRRPSGPFRGSGAEAPCLCLRSLLPARYTFFVRHRAYNACCRFSFASLAFLTLEKSDRL